MKFLLAVALAASVCCFAFGKSKFNFFSLPLCFEEIDCQLRPLHFEFNQSLARMLSSRGLRVSLVLLLLNWIVCVLVNIVTDPLLTMVLCGAKVDFRVI